MAIKYFKWSFPAAVSEQGVGLGFGDTSVLLFDLPLCCRLSATGELLEKRAKSGDERKTVSSCPVSFSNHKL